MKRYLLFLCLAWAAAAQTNLYLRPLGDAHNCLVIGTNNSSPDRITCQTVVTFSVGDRLVCGNFSGDSAPNRDDLKVKAVAGSTFTITDQNGNDIAGNGTWNNGTGVLGYGGGPQICGKVTAYPMTTAGHPYLWTSLTGRSGIEMAAKVDNGLLTSIVVSSNVATATYTRAHGLTTGMPLGVWGSGTAALNRPTYTIASTPTATTLTFATSGVADGTHMDPTLCVSAWAYTGNPPWDALASSSFTNAMSQFYSGSPANPIYGAPQFEPFQSLAVKCYVNELDTNSCTGAIWGLDHYENMVGEGTFGVFGDTGVLDDSDDLDYGVREGFQIASTFDLMYNKLSPTEIRTFIDKTWNQTGPSPTAVAGSGTMTCTGLSPATCTGTGTHFISEIPLGYVIDSPDGSGSNQKCMVTAVADDTHMTCYSGPQGTPVTFYPITSASWSGGVATVHLGSNPDPGAVAAGMVVKIENVSPVGYNVAAATILSANAGTVTYAVASNPGAFVGGGDVSAGNYSIKQSWQPGQKGYFWWCQYDSAMFPGQPLSHPFRGGSLQYSVPWNNGTWSHVGGAFALGLATAPDDSRGAYAAELTEEFFVDQMLPPISNWMTGPMGFGLNYDFHNGLFPFFFWELEMKNAVPTGPDLVDLDMNQWWGDWVRFNHLPATPTPSDVQNPRLSLGFATAYPPSWGAQGGPVGGYSNFTSGAQVVGMVSWLALNPTSPSTAKFHNWLVNKDPYWTSAQLSQPYIQGSVFMFAWPTIPTTSYSSDPTAKLFKPTIGQYNTCIGQGQASWQMPCAYPWGFQYVMSRTGWDVSPTSHDTVLQMTGEMFEQDHSAPRYSEWYVHKGDELIGPDSLLRGNRNGYDANNGQFNQWQIGTSFDQTLVDGITEVSYNSGVTTLLSAYGPNYSNFDRYSADTNTYAYGHLDFSTAMRPTIGVVGATREWAHMKDQSLAGEYVFVHTRFDLTGSPNTIIGDFVHYQQNGEGGEGTTTCPGTGGCATFSTNPEILSLSTLSGVHSKYIPMSGNRAYLDNTDGSYPNGDGHTFRVSGCAGSSSCSASATNYEMVQVHRLFWGTTDPGLAVTALNPDPNWTGAQTESAVVLFARGTDTHSTISNFTTTHSGTAEYLISGLTRGTYNVTVAGTAVTGSPFVVAAEDTTVKFSSTSGTVSIFAGLAPPPAAASVLLGKTSANGNVVIH